MKPITITIPGRSRTFLMVWMLLAVVMFGCVPKAPIHRNVEPLATPGAAGPNAEPTLPPKFEVTDRIEIKTSMGSMTIGLYGKDAPATVTNFLQYVDEGYFTKKIFHRVISGFMIQGGGYDEQMTHGDTREPIRLELIPGLKHDPGVISMARQPNDVHSATAQFFLCVSSAPQLNGSYAAFGKLEQGEEIMYAISGVPTHSIETEYGKMDDVPISLVTIESITRLP